MCVLCYVVTSQSLSSCAFCANRPEVVKCRAPVGHPANTVPACKYKKSQSGANAGIPHFSCTWFNCCDTGSFRLNTQHCHTPTEPTWTTVCLIKEITWNCQCRFLPMHIQWIYVWGTRRHLQVEEGGEEEEEGKIFWNRIFFSHSSGWFWLRWVDCTFFMTLSRKKKKLWEILSNMHFFDVMNFNVCVCVCVRVCKCVCVSVYACACVF